MQLLRHRTRTMRTTIETALLSVLLLCPLTALSALEKLDDAAMADVSGAGMAIALDDFRWMVKPTSYFEQVGSEPGSSTEFQRGDMRWYGINISGAGSDGSHWDENGSNGFGTSCNASSLGCPRGGTIADFSPHDNPYVLRAFSPEGIAYNGDPINDSGTSTSKTIYEYLAPTSQPDYTFSFWGEIEAGRTGDNSDLTEGTGDILKTQTIIRGNAANSAFRIFQFTQPDNETFAIMYHSYLHGDFRFSAAQAAGAGNDTVGVPVRFDNNAGLHFKNVDAYIPLGQLYYQALILDSVGTDGNFSLEIPRLRDPSIPYDDAINPAIEHFYSYAVDESLTAQVSDNKTVGYAGWVTARAAFLTNEYARMAGKDPWDLLPGDFGSNYSNFTDEVGAVDLPRSYFETHGYSRWGDWFPCQGVGCPNPPTVVSTKRNSYNDTSDGIFFRKCSNCTDFKALAYRQTAVDVRPGNNQYSTYDNYANYSSCTPGTSGSSRYDCGYGGAYADSPSVVVSNQTIASPMSIITRRGSSAGGPGTMGTAMVPYISTGVANLGDARIEGLQINHMKFTSYGAGAP